MLVLCWQMREPPRSRREAEGIAFFAQLGDCFARMRDPLLLWVFFAFVLKTTTEHVPYEFGQPYLAAVFDESTGDAVRTPLVAGFLVAGWQIVGAFASARAPWVQERLGVTGALLALAFLQGALITALALWIHPVIAALLVLRQVQAAVGNVIVHTTVTPRIPQLQRATYLSLHSLAGRLGYALVLLGLGSFAIGADAVDDLKRMLAASAVLAVAGALALAATRPFAGRAAAAPHS